MCRPICVIEKIAALVEVEARIGALTTQIERSGDGAAYEGSKGR